MRNFSGAILKIRQTAKAEVGLVFWRARGGIMGSWRCYRTMVFRQADFASVGARAVLIALVALSLVFPCRAATANDCFSRAVEFRFLGQTDAAITLYRRGLELDPGSVDGHTQLGTLLLEERGDVDGAMSEFITALGIDPGCRFCQQRLDEALDMVNSKSTDQVSRGNKLYTEGQLTRAAAVYRLAVHIDPSDGPAHNSLAWTLYRMGELDEGMREVREALRLKVDDPEFINTEACILFDKGDVDGAIARWRKAIALSKTPNPADLYGMAIGLLSKGDNGGATRYFEESLKADARYADLRFVRDRIGMSVNAVATHDRLISLAKKDKPALVPNQ